MYQVFLHWGTGNIGDTVYAENIGFWREGKTGSIMYNIPVINHMIFKIILAMWQNI